MKIFASLSRILLFLFLVTLGSNSNAGQDACEPAIPASLNAALKIRFSGWSVLRLSDLGQDDRSLWTKAHGRDCPGVAKGNFSRNGSPQYAILLKSGVLPSLRIQLLYAAQDASGNFQFLSVLKQHVDRLSVVYAGPPGRYSHPEDDKDSVRVTSDVIILETIESGATAYYLDKGSFKSILISE